MAQSKLGDFFVEIKAKEDTTGIDKFASKLNALAVIAGGIAIGAGVFSAIRNIANETANIGRISRQIGVSVEELNKLQKIFEFMGSSAGEATGLIENLHSTITGFKFGQYNESLGIMLGLAPQDFTNDFMKNIDLLRNRIMSRSAKDRKGILDALGLGQYSSVLITTNKEYKELLGLANSTAMATKKQTDDSEKFYKNIVLAKQSFRQFEREMITDLLPALGKLVKELSALFRNDKFKGDIKSLITTFANALPNFVSQIPQFISAVEKLANSLTTFIDFMGGISGDKTNDKSKNKGFISSSINKSPIGFGLNLLKRTPAGKFITQTWENAERKVSENNNYNFHITSTDPKQSGKEVEKVMKKQNAQKAKMYRSAKLA